MIYNKCIDGRDMIDNQWTTMVETIVFTIVMRKREYDLTCIESQTREDVSTRAEAARLTLFKPSQFPSKSRTSDRYMLCLLQNRARVRLFVRQSGLCLGHEVFD